jgi:hypothetical protein
MLTLACRATGSPQRANIGSPSRIPEQKPAAGKVTIKEIAKNDKYRVYEAIFKPGDEAPSVERPARVARALTSGTLERTYPDDKKETSAYKTGEVKLFDASKPYSLKNVGKTTLRLYVVQSL